MSKHTPGPWTAAPDTQRNKYAWRVEGASGTVPTIARLALVDRAEEIEPNARLIAAAPELLEVVKRVYEYERQRLVKENHHFHEGEIYEWEALINKAEGRVS